MSPLKFLPHAALTLLIASSLSTFAQQAAAPPDFKVNKLEVALLDSPTFQAGSYRKTSSGGGVKPVWLEIECSFAWAAREPLYLDELTVTYYIALDKATPKEPTGIVLTGSVVHVNVPQGKDLHSVMYVSPRALEKLFDGKAPTAVGQVYKDAAVVISYQGKEVASLGLKQKQPWWTNPAIKPIPGYLLNKSETPFAPLSWDYYESIKPKSSGQ